MPENNLVELLCFGPETVSITYEEIDRSWTAGTVVSLEGVSPRSRGWECQYRETDAAKFAEIGRYNGRYLRDPFPGSEERTPHRLGQLVIKV